MSWLPDSFLNGGLWPLLFIAALPLVLHILDRRRARHVEWPAMRFFLVESRREMRRLRLKEALLIALRTGALLLFGLALLRPASTVELRSHRSSLGRRGVIIALDTSYSMAYRPESLAPTRLEVAREGALRILDGLAPGDLVYVLAGTRRESRGRKAPLNPSAARRAVLEASLGGELFDLVRAVDLAVVLAVELPTPAREIHVFTDLQRAKKDVEAERRWAFLGSRMAQLRPRPKLSLVDCGAVDSPNRFVRALSGTELVLGVGEAVTLDFELGVSGGAEAPERARVFVDDRLILTAAEWNDGRMRATLEHRFETPGSKRVRVEIDHDGLVEDDARHLALAVRDRLDVLIVEARGRRTGRMSGDYIHRAAWPRAPGLAPPPTILRPRRALSVEGKDLREADVVILADVPRLSPDEAHGLESRVKAGGGLIVFAGSRVDAQNYNDALFRGGRGPLPSRLATRVSASRANPWHTGDISRNHPSLKVFLRPNQGDLGRIEFYALWQTAAASRDTSVLARVGGDTPWILERSFGRGRVLLVTTSALPGDTDLVLTPLFPPLIHRLVHYVAASAERPRSLVAGEPIEITLPSADRSASVTVIDPSGERHRLAIIGSDGRFHATFLHTQKPGFYQVEASPNGGPPQLQFFAVNTPAEESRLERMDDRTLSRVRELLGAEIVKSAAAAVPGELVRRVRREHWPYAISAALALFLAELCMLRTFTRGGAFVSSARKEAAPAPVRGRVEIRPGADE